MYVLIVKGKIKSINTYLYNFVGRQNSESSVFMDGRVATRVHELGRRSAKRSGIAGYERVH